MITEKSRTFVLVHGAWHGPWCWEWVSEHLLARGHDVVCPRLPSDMVAPLAIGNEAVSSLVLLAALVRRPGTVWAGSGLVPLAEPLRKVLARAVVDEAGRVLMDPVDGAEVFYHDCSPEAVDSDWSAAVAREVLELAGGGDER